MTSSEAGKLAKALEELSSHPGWEYFRSYLLIEIANCTRGMATGHTPEERERSRHIFNYLNQEITQWLPTTLAKVDKLSRGGR